MFAGQPDLRAVVAAAAIGAQFVGSERHGRVEGHVIESKRRRTFPFRDGGQGMRRGFSRIGRSLLLRARSASTVAGRHGAACVSFSGVSLLPDYSRQAEIYNETRATSPSVLRPLRGRSLNGAPGSRLADIGGGTGNYALALKREGWDPVVVDRSPEMLARAAAKGLEAVEADAQRLPFEDERFDAALMLSMLHHVADAD